MIDEKRDSLTSSEFGPPYFVPVEKGEQHPDASRQNGVMLVINENIKSGKALKVRFFQTSFISAVYRCE